MNSTGKGKYLYAILLLGKVTISLPVALTGFLGYFLYRSSLDRGALLTIAGVFLLSMGSSAINQVQERKIDAGMNRTRHRPIPAGIIPLSHAITYAVIFALSGALLLLLTGRPLSMFLGIFTLAWYNLVYTPLKKLTAFAVLPGALIGALPPLIGWTAAGGNPLDMTILSVAFLLFVGQMPHYWLLLLKVGDQFKKAGLPVITSLFDKNQIRNLSFIWISATGAIVLMLPVTPVIRNRLVSVILILLTALFLYRMFRLTYRGDIMVHWRRAFFTVNLYYLVIILMLIADRILVIWPQ